MIGQTRREQLRDALAVQLEREDEIAAGLRKLFKLVEQTPPEKKTALAKRTMQLRLLGEALREAQGERLRLEQQLAVFEQPRPEPRVGFWEFCQWLLGSVGGWLVRPRPVVAVAKRRR
jgi:hypothetical protein